MFNDRYSAAGLSLWGRAAFDPGTLMVASMAATAVGAGVSAAGTLAGGSYAKAAGQLQQQGAENTAEQIEQNANQAVASAQRQALDTGLRTRLAMSTSRARAAGAGVDAGFGSALTNQGELAQRGSYQAIMDLFNGQSTATGLRNQAAGVRFGGDVAAFEGGTKQSASQLAAAGTLAAGAGSMMKTYAGYNWPKVPWPQR